MDLEIDGMSFILFLMVLKNKGASSAYIRNLTRDLAAGKTWEI